MQNSSLKEDFEFLLADNGLTGPIKIIDEKIDPYREFKTSFHITVTRNFEARSVSGSLRTGRQMQNLQDVEQNTKNQLDDLIGSEIDKIGDGSSQLLRIKSGNHTLKTEDFYIVKTCPPCSGEGKIPCNTCNRTGRITCRNCSGSGNLKCQSCNGSGTSFCSTCAGSGKVPEYFRSLDDDAWDKMAKDHGYAAYKKCISCNGKGAKICLSCGGRKIQNCSNCGGKSIVTCDTCNGSTRTTCNSCSGHGCKSDVKNGTAILRSTHQSITLSKADALAQSCLQKSYDAFLSGAEIQKIQNTTHPEKNKEKWTIAAHTQYEWLSIVNKNSSFELGRFSNSNATLSATEFLDETLMNVASDALAKINSASQFKDNISEFPGVIRWAFGEKVRSPRHEIIRPMYNSLLSANGKKAIISMRDDYLGKAAAKLFWPFFLVTAPILIGSLIFIVKYFDLEPLSTFATYASSLGVSLTAYILAHVFAYLYVSRASRL